MRLDFCKMTSSTGGTSTLTCSAQTGYPLPSEAFTGTRLIDYSIAEYTSSAKTQLSKAETGVGSYNTSTEVLTRTKVLSTWDATDYRPKFGTATAPTALNFGTTSANIDIMVSPVTGTGRASLPFVPGAVGSVSDGLGVAPANTNTVSNIQLSPTSGTIYYWPAEWMYSAMLSQVAVRQTTGTTGGSPTLDVAIYEVGTDGLPGKMLVQFTQMAVGTVNTNYQSTALATPVFLPAGFYYFAILFLVGGGSGGGFRGSSATGGTWGYTLLANATSAVGPGLLASQTVLSDPATAATSHANSASVVALYFK